VVFNGVDAYHLKSPGSYTGMLISPYPDQEGKRDRRFLFSYSLLKIIIGGILALYIYIYVYNYIYIYIYNYIYLYIIIYIYIYI